MSRSSSISPLSQGIVPRVAPARASVPLILLLWVCVLLALLIGICGPLGFWPMTHWGSDWTNELRTNRTQTVVYSVSSVALAAALFLAGAAVLAMARPRVHSTMWLRHLLVAGYVLIGMYVFTGVRIVNLIFEKDLRLEVAQPAPASKGEHGAKEAPPVKAAPTTAPAAPATQKSKVPAAPVTPGTAKPTGLPAVGGPTMKTDGIDLDAPVVKPPPVEPKPDVPVPAPAVHPAPPIQAPAAATQSSSSPAATKPAASQSALTTQAAASEIAAPPEDTSDETPPPEIIVNQYRLYMRTRWNLVAAIAAVALFVSLIFAQIWSAQLAQSIPVSSTPGASLNDGRQDVGFHSNMDTSIIVHVVLILIISSFLLLHWPKVQPPLDFSTPGGGGGEPEQVVKVTKKKKPPKKVRKYVSSKNSAIAFFVPKMEDSKVAETTDKETENQFKVETGTGGHGHGKGKGKGNGHGSGWGNGTGKVRFYHLHYSGDNTNWDDGFTDHKDSNLLHEWEQRERKDGSDLPFGDAIALNVSDLRRDIHGLLPPFVFVTGNVGLMSDHETKIVRKYIDEGGMIFADPQLNLEGSFINWAQQKLFPGERLLPLDNRQDPIFDGRYYFAGPPAFWSGNKSFLGLKHGDRWVIICDRGRMADGWKPPINEDCVRMGINIIDYAHDHYANAPGH